MNLEEQLKAAQEAVNSATWEAKESAEWRKFQYKLDLAVTHLRLVEAAITTEKRNALAEEKAALQKQVAELGAAWNQAEKAVSYRWNILYADTDAKKKLIDKEMEDAMTGVRAANRAAWLAYEEAKRKLRNLETLHE